MKNKKRIFIIFVILTSLNNNVKAITTESLTSNIQPTTKSIKTEPKESTLEKKEEPKITDQDITEGPIQIFSKPENKKLVKSLSPWISPNPKLRYNQVCYLGTHNCNSAYNLGYKPYAQQKWNIKEQLEHGIRCFLPDIWPTEMKTNKECKREEGETIDNYSKKATIRMCHGPCKINPILRPAKLLKGFVKLKKIKKMTTPLFSDMLKTIKEFIEKDENKKEIITLILENYADRDLVDHVLEEIPELTNLIFKEDDWDFKENKGNWPTIEWMLEKNKRLVIFNDNCRIERDGTIPPTKYTLPIWKYVTENEFGKINDLARTERGQSYDRRNYHQKDKTKSFSRKLLFLNYFITFPIPLEHKTKLIKFLKTFKNNTQYSKLNTTGIESLINYVYLNGLDKRADKESKSDVEPGKLPNFIALDFVNKGNAMAIINLINQKQEESLKEQTKTEETQKPLKQIKSSDLPQQKESTMSKIVNKVKSIFLPGY